MNSVMHPFRILIGGIALLLTLYLGFSLFLSIGSELTGNGLWQKNWPFTVAGVVWLVLFSSGVVGCVVNLVTALTLPNERPVKTFTELRQIDKDEYQAADQWLNLHVYDLEHLKEMWGEDRD